MNEYTDIGERFMAYAAVTTQSEEGHTDTPSTACQRDLAALLAKELAQMGASDVSYDEEHCYVYATVPSNLPLDAEAEKKLAARSDRMSRRRENLAPVIGLMAHMDTSSAVAGKKVIPRRIAAYDGSSIVLNEKLGIVLSPKEYPSLKKHIGSDLIVADGTSVLGGDDKAGVAEIMEVFAFYLSHPEYAHGTIRCCFTPDEEVGNGPENIDLSRFACDYAYTADGGDLGQIEYENFNAASADITINGISTHPGDAKGCMRNAILVAAELIDMFPKTETPFCTSGREGFYHVEQISGTTDRVTLEYLLRDHDRTRFEERKNIVRRITDTINAEYAAGAGQNGAASKTPAVELVLKDSYYNMREKIEPHMHLIENAEKALLAVGVTPDIKPIRGGTDGCRLSFMGIPCPNLGTGAYNFHSRYEYVSVSEMKKGVEVLKRIINLYAPYELDPEK
ncbi:MAG: peptidase T [Lachnospiraceae bacterium]|jgi:tripeptide aminopeptidase|nr:peptidase T [Lachnospiraceae bacterium]